MYMNIIYSLESKSYGHTSWIDVYSIYRGKTTQTPSCHPIAHMQTYTSECKYTVQSAVQFMKTVPLASACCVAVGFHWPWLFHLVTSYPTDELSARKPHCTGRSSGGWSQGTVCRWTYTHRWNPSYLLLPLSLAGFGFGSCCFLYIWAWDGLIT